MGLFFQNRPLGYAKMKSFGQAFSKACEVWGRAPQKAAKQPTMQRFANFLNKKRGRFSFRTCLSFYAFQKRGENFSKFHGVFPSSAERPPCLAGSLILFRKEAVQFPTRSAASHPPHPERRSSVLPNLPPSGTQ